MGGFNLVTAGGEVTLVFIGGGSGRGDALVFGGNGWGWGDWVLSLGGGKRGFGLGNSEEGGTGVGARF